jgi:hypothetical protein
VSCEVHLVRSPGNEGLYEARLHFDEDVGFPELVGTGHDPTKACIDLLVRIGGVVEGSETRVSDPQQPPQNPPPNDVDPRDAESRIHVWEQDGRQNAMVGELPFGGVGETKAQAISCLADLFANALDGHGQTIDTLRAVLQQNGIKDPTSMPPGTREAETKPEPVGEVLSDLAVSVPPPAETTPGEVEAHPVPSDG